MKKWIAAFLIAVCFHACIPSVHPLYTAKDLVSNSQLPGHWKETDTPENKWHFSAKGKGQYELFYDEGGKRATFELHLIELGKQYYLDFFPDSDELSNTRNLVESQKDSTGFSTASNFLYQSTMIPMHLFAKVEINQSTLKLHLFDQDWLEKMILERRIKIRHEKMKDRILLTASTAELQQFVLKYQHTEKAYSETLILTRN